MKLNEIGKGALQEIFDYEFDKVLKNIKDINTDPKATRKIGIEITIKPDEKRNLGSVDFKIKKTEAPINGFGTTILMEQGRAGEISITETGGEIPGQVGLDNVIDFKEAK